MVVDADDLFADGGRVGALMRAHDWSQSPLGPPATWPLSLRTVVGLLLRSRFPMFVAWGHALGFLYNDAYAEILGAKHPAALGRPFSEIWAEIWSDISPLIDAAMAGEASYREDLPLVMNRKGYDEQAWFTFSYSPVRDEEGRVAGMFCAVSETTRRVIVERALRDSERRLLEMNETLERRVAEGLAERRLLAEIVEGTRAFVQVVDLDYRWLAVNRAAADEFERIFGIRPHVGASMLELLADQPEQQAAVKAMWARAFAGEEFTAIEVFGDPDRDQRAYEMRFNTLHDRTGQRIGAYQFVYDVTERLRSEERLRAAEDSLRQAQKMEALGQLTSGVAHDFNNLLAVFSTALQLLERTGRPATPPMLDALRRAISRGAGLTRQLLTFSRRRPLHLEAFDVVAHLTSMRAMLEASVGSRIVIDTRFARGTWAVEADPGEMELAILNLCVNARDAMSDGGVITIATRNVGRTQDSASAGDYVRITVSDTGCGMSPEVQARAFEPFFTTKDVNKGSGLGLPQVYGFAQQSNGRVEIDSALGVGTTVTLFLPRAAQAAIGSLPSREVPLSTAVDYQPAHLLLVEDDPEVSTLTLALLTSLGLTVTTASDAETALRMLAEPHDVDIVFSDVMMPGAMNGLELARAIRALHPSLPVLLTTGNVESIPDMADGEFPLLIKPYTDELLSATLAAARSAPHAPAPPTTAG